MDLKQFADGSMGIYSDLEGAELFRVGGPKSPTSSTPNFRNGSWLKLNANGGTDTAGGLTSWQNNLGYDIIVTGFVLDVTTVATAACTASFGQTATSGVTSATTFLSAKDVNAATGSFPNAATLSKKVPVNTWITGSVGTGASAGLVANAYFEFIPV
jgi:hypothetical protein